MTPSHTTDAGTGPTPAACTQSTWLRVEPDRPLRRRSAYLGPSEKDLDPKTDVVFKLLFAAEKNRPLLVKLLTAVLNPPSPIAHVEVRNPYIDPRDLNDKRAVLDILVRFSNGTHVDVDMQVRPHHALEERLVFYWATVFTSQLASGDSHAALKPVIGVYFLDFIRLPTERLHSTFHINEDHEGYPLTHALELHFLELPRFTGLPLPSGVAAPSDGDPTDELVYWCKFLCAESEQDLEALAMANQDMSEAKQALEQLSADPAARKLAEDRILWDWAYRTDMAHEREEGLQQGLQQGLRKGQRNAVRAACSAFGIELTDDRTKRLEAATDAELDSLLAALLRDQSWPG